LTPARLEVRRNASCDALRVYPSTLEVPPHGKAELTITDALPPHGKAELTITDAPVARQSWPQQGSRSTPKWRGACMHSHLRCTTSRLPYVASHTRALCYLREAFASAMSVTFFARSSTCERGTS